MMYYLLPFKFHRTGSREILVSELGNYLMVPSGTADDIVSRRLSCSSEQYKDLVSGGFITETPLPVLIDNFAVRLRTKKAFLSSFTALHIFVLTLRCNQNCIYCQASSRKQTSSGCDMKEEHLKLAIDLMFNSPAKDLTMEFQGGEPSLVPDLLACAVEYAEIKNSDKGKNITYVLCTNSIDISDQLLELCVKYKIFISTSFDGPAQLHNHNRGKADSFAKLMRGINRFRSLLGSDSISPLMTTSLESLKYSKEIVESYIAAGFNHIFLRPLNPYGILRNEIDWEKYTADFIAFYKETLEYIIQKNLNGIFFSEDFTTIILKKILTPFSDGFVDLQSPAGIVNSVIVYNYDGCVYASDESRMLAESGDKTFRMGHVKDSYKSIFYGRKTQELSRVWATEYIAGCSDCAFQSYCGSDPVRNHTMQNDIYGFRPNSHLCKMHKAVFEHIFSLLDDSSRQLMPIFQAWIMGQE